MKKDKGERAHFCSTKTISSIDTSCKHKWKFIKGGFWKDDKMICEKCGSWKLAALH